MDEWGRFAPLGDLTFVLSTVAMVMSGTGILILIQGSVTFLVLCQLDLTGGRDSADELQVSEWRQEFDPVADRVQLPSSPYVLSCMDVALHLFLVLSWSGGFRCYLRVIHQRFSQLLSLNEYHRTAPWCSVYLRPNSVDSSLNL